METGQMTFDELHAIGEMDLFLAKAIKHCKIKLRSVRLAGMDIDDVAQEAVIKVYKSLEKYDSKTSKLTTYVDHVIDNMIRDCLRKAGSLKNLMVTNADELVLNPDTETDFMAGIETIGLQHGIKDMGYENTEDFIDVTEHMNLTAQEKKVFILRMEGYEFAEIAKSMGVTKSRLSQVWSSVKTKYALMD
jgi:RNA polymerase sporulation-specific sigma factor